MPTSDCSIASRHRRRRSASSSRAPRSLLYGPAGRATRDLDLLALRDGSEDHVRGVFERILSTKVVDDGVVFDLSTLAVRPIREDQEYGGVRVTVVAKIDSARVSLQVDVGFGDAITPRPSIVDYPVLLDFPAPKLHAYPRETVIAEKLDAMVQLGIANSRMKDFFDLHVLSRSFDFDSTTLVAAVKATFHRRKTPLPGDVPIALTQEFATDKSKATQWRAFISKSGADFERMSLPQVVADIGAFLLPVPAIRVISAHGDSQLFGQRSLMGARNVDVDHRLVDSAVPQPRKRNGRNR